MPIQILLADDHQLVRQGLKLLLEREGFKVTAEAGNGHEAVKLALDLLGLRYRSRIACMMTCCQTRVTGYASRSADSLR